MTRSKERGEMGESARRHDYDTIVIGAGITGLYQLYRLRELGLSVRVFEAGGPASAAPGIGIATQAAASIPRVTPTATRSQRNCWTNGTGRSISLPSRRPSATSITSRTSSTCAGTSSSIPGHVGDLRRGKRDVGDRAGRRPRYRSRYLVTAVGPLSAPTMPRIAGIDDFGARPTTPGAGPSRSASRASGSR